jgi:probable phosphomutase (TIGR03848 family)
MPLVLLIRHGLTDHTGKRLTGWTPGIHLSKAGRAQADGLVERLAEVPVDAIYSSPLERCVETAKPLAASLKLRVRTLKDVGEVRYGDWTGKPLAQLARTKLWKTVQQNPSNARFPNGESLLEVQERAVAAVESIAAEHPKQVVAVFSHGDPIRLLIAHYSGIHADLFQRLVVAPASVSAIAVSIGAESGAGRPFILRVNDSGTLSDLAPTRRKGRR